ncbi:hypothetical protein [Mucilaginibacter polytrichastri]|nr:hypothetical protein [Mucilaginibacter polytrichastri]SFT00552.1 hypothetical protein SAMN04487890_10840 [Mucilaginibacter polytrichastri]
MKYFFSSNKKSTGIFIPQGSDYSELTDNIEDTSIVGVSAYLGYHTDQIQVYHTDYNENDDISNVIFEAFTKNIIYVLTKTSCLKVTNRDVNHRLRSYDWAEEYDSYTVRDILEKGVANKSLTIDFLSKVLPINDPEPNGIFPVEKIGFYLYFNHGYLTDFQSLDGLGTWAKYFQKLNPRTITLQEAYAKKYWGNNISQVIKEVNTQSDALANVPELFKNKYSELHTTEIGTINFVMLLVCHYRRNIDLNDFIELNHGRYQQITPTIYSLGKFIYEFSDEGNNVKITQIKGV